LFNACGKGDDNKVRQILLGGRADIDYITSAGSTAAYVAAQEGHVNCLKLLTQRGADLNKQADNGNGYAPIHIACQLGRLDCIAWLLGKVDVNSATFKGGATPAMIACMNGHLQVLKLLIEHQADLNRPDFIGNTPLHYASIFGRYKLVSLLIQNHVDINARNARGETPLFLARQHGHSRAMKLLMEHEAEDEGGERRSEAELEEFKVQLIHE
jgi:ankyrin repeat protein